MVSPATIDRAVQELIRTAQPEQIILFGSYARGEATDESDVDLIVVVKDLPKPRTEWARLRRVLLPLGIPVDLLVVTRDSYTRWSEAVSSTFYWANREGKVLYSGQ